VADFGLHGREFQLTATIHCDRCRQPIPGDATTCPHCGHTLSTDGLSLAASAMVILSVSAILLFAGVAFAVREQQPVALATASTSATPAPVAAEPSATSRPSAAPGTYLVGDGESIFSVAEATGIDANLLIYWNAETYPSLSLTPALSPGWVLELTGPMLPTPSPKPTSAPPTYSPYPIPSLPPVAGLPSIPVIDATMFSGPTVVHTYEINGITPNELARSIATNGPYDTWTGGHAEATTQVHVSYQFSERTLGDSCEIVTDSSTPISLSYVVTIPHWAPPPGATAATRDWWIDELITTVHHENHHVEIWQAFLPAFTDAVLNGTCDRLAADLASIVQKANTANCQFDMDEYGTAAGLRIEDCLASH
jgi:predicted secreted Zn-dependent protease